MSPSYLRFMFTTPLTYHVLICGWILSVHIYWFVYSRLAKRQHGTRIYQFWKSEKQVNKSTRVSRWDHVIFLLPPSPPLLPVLMPPIVFFSSSSTSLSFLCTNDSSKTAEPSPPLPPCVFFYSSVCHSHQSALSQHLGPWPLHSWATWCNKEECRFRMCLCLQSPRFISRARRVSTSSGSLCWPTSGRWNKPDSSVICLLELALLKYERSFKNWKEVTMLTCPVPRAFEGSMGGILTCALV